MHASKEEEAEQTDTKKESYSKKGRAEGGATDPSILPRGCVQVSLICSFLYIYQKTQSDLAAFTSFLSDCCPLTKIHFQPPTAYKVRRRGRARVFDENKEEGPDEEKDGAGWGAGDEDKEDRPG